MILVAVDAPIPAHYQQWVRDLPGIPANESVRLSFSNPAGVEEPAYTRPGEPIYITRRELVDRYVLVHEIGHQVDYRTMTDEGRALVMRFVLHRTGDWRQPVAPSPHEEFADAYADSVIGPDRAHPRPRTGPRRRQLLTSWLHDGMVAKRMTVRLSVLKRRWAAEDTEEARDIDNDRPGGGALWGFERLLPGQAPTVLSFVDDTAREEPPA